jgi:tetratricopeptide (TPR) repeat protein
MNGILQPIRRRTGRAVVLASALASAAAAGAVVARRAEEPDRLYARALAAFEAGRWDRAEAALNRADRSRPPTAADWMLRARIGLARGREEEALDALARVPDDDPRGPGARLRRGQVQLRMGRLRAAEADLLRAAELNPKQAQARRELVYLYGMQMRRDGLDAQFRALATLGPLTYDDALVWGLARGPKWNAEEVVADLRRFVATDPEERWSRLALAETLRQQGRADDAEEALAPLPATDPDARALRGALAVDRGDVPGAESLAAAGPSDHPGLARLRGRLALQGREWAAAARHFRAALATEPGHRDALYGLALALQQMDDPAARPYRDAARARDELNQRLERAARDRGGDNPDALRELAEACEAVGRLPEARAWYELAIARDPLDARAQRALHRLGVGRDVTRVASPR